MPPTARRQFAGFALAVALVTLAIAQLTAAYLGAKAAPGAVWIWLAAVGAASIGSALPLILLAFVGAMRTWHWHWMLAAIFAAPRLLTIVPGLVTAMLASLRHR